MPALKKKKNVKDLQHSFIYQNKQVFQILTLNMTDAYLVGVAAPKTKFLKTFVTKFIS